MTQQNRETLLAAKQVALDHAQRCRTIISESPAWGQAQAEWSRARDVAMDIADAIEDLRATASSLDEVVK